MSSLIENAAIVITADTAKMAEGMKQASDKAGAGFTSSMSSAVKKVRDALSSPLVTKFAAPVLTTITDSAFKVAGDALSGTMKATLGVTMETLPRAIEDALYKGREMFGNLVVSIADTVLPMLSRILTWSIESLYKLFPNFTTTMFRWLAEFMEAMAQFASSIKGSESVVSALRVGAVGVRGTSAELRTGSFEGFDFSLSDDQRARIRDMYTDRRQLGNVDKRYEELMMETKERQREVQDSMEERIFLARASSTAASGVGGISGMGMGGQADILETNREQLEEQRKTRILMEQAWTGQSPVVMG